MYNGVVQIRMGLGAMSSRVSQSQIDKACCDAMLNAGVKDARTARGIEYCTTLCPYPHCVIAEPAVHWNTIRRVTLRRRVTRLQNEGKSVREIAELIGKSIRAVQKLLDGQKVK